MNEPIVLRNDVPMLERLVAVFFGVVVGPLTYLGWTEPEELPDLVVPVVQVGLPLFFVVVVRWVFVRRHRVVVTLQPDDPVAVFEERVLFVTKRWSGSVVGVDIEIGEDIDGDPYGSLVLRVRDKDDVVAAEGNDIETLESHRREVQEWLDRTGR